MIKKDNKKSKNKKLPKSVRIYIRKNKSIIRRNEASEQIQIDKIKLLYLKFGLDRSKQND